MNLPAIYHIAHHSQQWVTPELELNSTEKWIPRLGKVDKEVALFNKKEFLQLSTYTHNS
jgi:hypothetical protein